MNFLSMPVTAFRSSSSVNEVGVGEYQRMNPEKSNHEVVPGVKHGKRVLIVEDDLELTQVIDQVIHSIDPNAHVEWATTGEQVMSILRSRSKQGAASPYDLIVADIFLEGEKTGIDIWSQCQTQFPNVPIVITSALPVERFLSAVGQATVTPPFLAKPFSVGECKTMVEGLFKYQEQRGRA